MSCHFWWNFPSLKCWVYHYISVLSRNQRQAWTAIVLRTAHLNEPKQGPPSTQPSLLYYFSKTSAMKLIYKHIFTTTTPLPLVDLPTSVTSYSRPCHTRGHESCRLDGWPMVKQIYSWGPELLLDAQALICVQYASPTIKYSINTWSFWEGFSFTAKTNINQEWGCFCSVMNCIYLHLRWCTLDVSCIFPAWKWQSICCCRSCKSVPGAPTVSKGTGQHLGCVQT